MYRDVNLINKCIVKIEQGQFASFLSNIRHVSVKLGQM